MRRQGIGFASAIETWETCARHVRGIRGRQGIGFASAIETFNAPICPPPARRVARGLASRLRLKPIIEYTNVLLCLRRQGIGFASAIETKSAL